MDISQAKRLCTTGDLTQVEVMRSPENRRTWFISLRDTQGWPLFLVDEAEKVQIFHTLEDAVNVVQLIGFKTMNVHV